MEKYHLQVKTTENYHYQWGSIPPIVTLVGRELVKPIADAILAQPDAVEVRASLEDSPQGYYYSTPESMDRVRSSLTIFVFGLIHEIDALQEQLDSEYSTDFRASSASRRRKHAELEAKARELLAGGEK
jgi:hypothetical protein